MTFLVNRWAAHFDEDTQQNLNVLTTQLDTLNGQLAKFNLRQPKSSEFEPLRTAMMKISALIAGEMGRHESLLLEATLKGVIPWEATADPNTLTGQLEGDYSLRLEQVPDFDEAPDVDFILSLRKGRRTVLTVDRREFSQADIKSLFSNRF